MNNAFKVVERKGAIAWILRFLVGRRYNIPVRLTTANTNSSIPVALNIIHPYPCEEINFLHPEDEAMYKIEKFTMDDHGYN